MRQSVCRMGVRLYRRTCFHQAHIRAMYASITAAVSPPFIGPAMGVFFLRPAKIFSLWKYDHVPKNEKRPDGRGVFFCFPPNGGVFVRPVYKIIEYRNRPNKRIIELTVSFAKDYTTLPYRKCVNDPCPNLRNLHPEIRIRYFELRPNYSQSKIALGYQVCL